jgi:hypothetical protein
LGKRFSKLALMIVLVLICVQVSVPLVLAAVGTPVANQEQLITLISDAIKQNKAALDITYEPGRPSSAFVGNAIEAAVGRNLSSVCKTEGYSYKISGDAVEIKLSYGKAKDYDCFFAPTLSDVYYVTAQNIKAGKTRFALYYPDERNTQTLSTVVESLRHNLTFYQGAGIDEYFMYNLLSVKAEAFEAAGSAGGFVVLCEFEYAETPDETAKVMETAREVIASFNFADQPLNEKVRRINQWVINNAAYGDDGTNVSHSAYEIGRAHV